MAYLLDTNICIFFMKGMFDLKEKVNQVGVENCYISEITFAELKFGVANSSSPEKNHEVLTDFLTGIQIIPIFHSIDVYAKEKARLRKEGTPTDDFDLLIGATSIANQMIMVTNNKRHFLRLKDIQIEDWTIS